MEDKCEKDISDSSQFFSSIGKLEINVSLIVEEVQKMWET